MNITFILISLVCREKTKQLYTTQEISHNLHYLHSTQQRTYYAEHSCLAQNNHTHAHTTQSMHIQVSSLPVHSTHNQRISFILSAEQLQTGHRSYTQHRTHTYTSQKYLWLHKITMHNTKLSHSTEYELTLTHSRTEKNAQRQLTTLTDISQYRTLTHGTQYSHIPYTNSK